MFKNEHHQNARQYHDDRFEDQLDAGFHFAIPADACREYHKEQGQVDEIDHGPSAIKTLTHRSDELDNATDFTHRLMAGGGWWRW